MRALLVIAALSGPAAAETWTVPAPSAPAAAIDGTDAIEASGTMSFMGGGHTIAATQALTWRATGDALALTSIVSDRTQDGRVTHDDEATVRAQVERSRVVEAVIAAQLVGRTFTRDQPVAIDPASLRALDAGREIVLDRLIVTWTGTSGPIAQFRIYSSFALTSAVAGRATVAGGLDLDVVHGALVDVRLAGVVTTDRVAFIDLRAHAHLHRTLR